MNDIQIRIPQHIARRLLDEVTRRGFPEPVVFALASHAKTRSQNLIVLRELIIPPPSAYIPSQGHGARWSGAYMVELLNRALDQQLGLFIFHAHLGDPDVSMSRDDRASATELLPKFQLVLPQRPHGSIVVGAESIAGLILMPDNDILNEYFSLRMMAENSFRTWPLPPATPDEYLLFQRQPLTDNPFLKRKMNRMVIAVVGLSGGGSQAISQIATFGVREIIAIDDQRADKSNRLATPNLGWIDALVGLRKTTAAKWRGRAIDRNIRFTSINARVPEPKALDALKRADIIIGCVNNLHARADLNEIAWRYCIPYIDIGLSLTTQKEALTEPRPLSAISGNLFTAIPGGPCLWCAEFLTQAKLDRETGGQGRSYLRDTSGRDALVAPLNGVLAAEAASEVLRLISGIGAQRECRRQYDGFSGTLLEMTIAKKQNCPLCTSMLAAGDPVWLPIQC